MKNCLLICLVSWFSLSAFSGTVTLNMNHDNLARNFLVHTPPGFSSSQHLPVIINLHGYGSDGPQQEFYSRMSETSDSNNFIVVYPNGLSNQWNSGFTPPYNGGTDDVGFISKIIDTLYTLYNIDLSRVYACGMSNGGYQSYRLACDLENRIAAIASVTGTITSLTALNCVLSRNIPVMEIHGTEDPLVPYGGSTGSLSVEDNINFWLSKNQCNTTSDTLNLPDTNPLDSSTVERIYYRTCGNGTEVVFYKITGGGHTWPNAPLDWIYGPTNRDFDASQEIWNFFNRFTLNGPVSGIEHESARLTVNVFPNPGAGIYNIQILNYEWEKPLQLVMYNMDGKKVMEGSVFSPLSSINIKHLAAGIYLLHAEEENITISTRLIKE